MDGTADCKRSEEAEILLPRFISKLNFNSFAARSFDFGEYASAQDSN